MKRRLALLIALTAATWASGRPPPQFEQKVGTRLPLETIWRDESGRPTELRALLQGRPFILMFGYYKCPQLCSVVQRGAVDSLRNLGPSIGRDFDFFYASIDPTDTAEAARAERSAAVRQYGRGDSLSGWHYLTGARPSITAMTEAAGFHYDEDRRSGTYAHPAGLLVLTPDGTVSRYFLGVDFSPDELAGALRRAGRGETGETVYNLIVECFRGEGVGGRYGPLIWRTLEAGVALTVLGLGGAIAWMLREERNRRRPEVSA